MKDCTSIMNQPEKEANTDADWNAWKEKAKSLGADKLIANYTAAQKRFDAE